MNFHAEYVPRRDGPAGRAKEQSRRLPDAAMGDSGAGGARNCVPRKPRLNDLLGTACGRGHMSVALAGYFRTVTSSDVFDYGFGQVADFLKSNHAEGSRDWVITNPPFRLGEEFIGRAMKIARHGVA